MVGEKLGQYVWNNRERRGEGERWRRCERRREVSRDVEMGGGGGGGGGWGEMSPQCSAVSASSAGGAGGVPSPYSPTHTDTHASLYNGCFTLVPERERLRESERETW